MRIVWSLICVLCCLFLFSGAAIGDTDIYHTPTKEQLSESEALKVATAFWLELCSVDISEEIDAGNYTALFGPGYQWGANTENDCWIIDISISADIPIQPSIVIHGTLGNVVYWQFRDKETKISYICAMPDDTGITENEAAEIAIEYFKVDANLTENELSELSVRRSFGYAQYYVEFENMPYEDHPIWSILISSSTGSFSEVGHYFISARDGTVLMTKFLLDPEFK